ncbi:glycosyltransferase family 2 protein [uncultured Clostridium sp.]|uniref:glycosyltransferase family 2 protein n=1 Tax=uncultured Clostridium sp. TaxID=59620 RepID=UPI0025F8F10B|nr:glycosyltransferase family 2 protein [uncultured Clostridium sp.]
MEKIAAIVVTYNPDEGLNKSTKSLIKQVDSIIMVDNGSNDEGKEIINKIKNKYGEKIEVIFNEENLGIATALNKGVKYALNNDYKWILTMDQDSCAEENMVKIMLETYYAIDENERKDILSLFPTFIDRGIESLDKNNENVKYEYVDAEITSGNLLKAEIFEKAGFFDDSLFIDMVDTDYCMRLNELGIKMIRISGAILNHSIGNSKQVKKLFGTFNTSNHSATRRYYMTRNRFYTWNKYKNLNSFTLNRDKKLFKKEFVKIILGEDDKLNKVKMVLKGYKDYKNGVRGKLK